MVYFNLWRLVQQDVVNLLPYYSPISFACTFESFEREIARRLSRSESHPDEETIAVVDSYFFGHLC